MFVVQEAVAKNSAATEDLNGKLMISFLIIFANAAAGGLYPLYRFVTAWAENTIEEDHDSGMKEVGVAPVDGDRAAREAFDPLQSAIERRHKMGKDWPSS